MLKEKAPRACVCYLLYDVGHDEKASLEPGGGTTKGAERRPSGVDAKKRTQLHSWRRRLTEDGDVESELGPSPQACPIGEKNGVCQFGDTCEFTHYRKKELPQKQRAEQMHLEQLDKQLEREEEQRAEQTRLEQLDEQLEHGEAQRLRVRQLSTLEEEEPLVRPRMRRRRHPPPDPVTRK